MVFAFGADIQVSFQVGVIGKVFAVITLDPNTFGNLNLFLY